MTATNRNVQAMTEAMEADSRARELADRRTTKGSDLVPGDIIISRTSDGQIFEADMVQEIDSDRTIRRAYVQRWWPNEPTRLATSSDIVRYVGSDADLEVVR